MENSAAEASLALPDIQREYFHSSPENMNVASDEAEAESALRFSAPESSPEEAAGSSRAAAAPNPHVVPSFSELRMDSIPLHRLGLEFPPTTSPSEANEMAVLLKNELTRQELEPPALPPSKVEDLPKKEVAKQYRELPENATWQEKNAIRHYNNMGKLDAAVRRAMIEVVEHRVRESDQKLADERKRNEAIKRSERARKRKAEIEALRADAATLDQIMASSSMVPAPALTSVYNDTSAFNNTGGTYNSIGGSQFNNAGGVSNNTGGVSNKTCVVSSSTATSSSTGPNIGAIGGPCTPTRFCQGNHEASLHHQEPWRSMTISNPRTRAARQPFVCPFASQNRIRMFETVARRAGSSTTPESSPPPQTDAQPLPQAIAPPPPSPVFHSEPMSEDMNDNDVLLEGWVHEDSDF
ncbi:hypothetical protein GMORB2_4096 [Geosmithia morbida]|uniref:Uncharacterized protein n=1 Tax=Geosmithia morbida TaxID=1094350 RepID=A0A9P4YY66_9HYPO|nr:uncharacterized protein GMORB2_4096 [Geosmithia morbida]KAF4125256.1 hypothetical protein GMORB2_4096 [Geosmithia morbida]